MADTVTAVIIGAYFLPLIGIGAWGSKKIHTTEDYIVAGRSLDFWVLTILMVASICSGMTLVGVSRLGFVAGWPSIWEQLFVPLSAAFCIIVFGVKIHHVGKKAGYITVQDYFVHRFESPRAIRGLSAVAGVVVSAIYLVGQYTAISIVLMWLFDIPTLGGAAHCRYHHHPVHGNRWPVRSFLDDLGPGWDSYHRRHFYGTAGDA